MRVEVLPATLPISNRNQWGETLQTPRAIPEGIRAAAFSSFGAYSPRLRRQRTFNYAGDNPLTVLPFTVRSFC